MTPSSIAVAICTYKRNDALANLLEKLGQCVNFENAPLLGVVIVDDTSTGDARPVADRFAAAFPVGVEYLISGKQNISLARNLALEAAATRGDWVLMTDDDCEPPALWIKSLLAVQARTGSDAVTGLMLRRPPPGSPRWIGEQPFLTLGALEADDGERLDTAFTNNVLIRSRWVRDHESLRFDPALGVLGGEDMAFFREAVAQGLDVRFSRDGFVYENEPMSRMTFKYQLRRFYWQGNSSYVTHKSQGTGSARLLIHGLAALARAAVRPFSRVVNGKTPQWRFAAASVFQAAGVLAGCAGVRVDHH